MSITTGRLIPAAEPSPSPLATRPLIRRIAAAIVVWAVLAAITWICHFSLSRQMGFYEDDYACAVPTMSWQWPRMEMAITTQLKAFPGWEGRALGWILLSLIPWVSYRAGGVEGMFVSGFLIVWLNSVLLHRLLRRRFVEPLPILAAIAFILFPADTTRSYILHNDQLEISLTFMLIAANLYLAGGVWRRIVSYMIAGLCMITYESAILPFVTIPLLDKKPPGQTRKARTLNWLIHGAVLLAIPISLTILRIARGEPRVIESSQNLSTLARHIISGMWIGPQTVLYSYWGRAREGYVSLKAGGTRHWPALGICAIFSLAGAWPLRPRRQSPGYVVKSPEIGSVWRDLVPAFAFGAVALPVSYLLAFTHYPPNILVGRLTSVHLAASIGAAVLFAATATLILRVARQSGYLLLTAGVIGLYSTLLYSAAMGAQWGMVDAWYTQQRFWAQVTTLCPDLKRGTLVICDGLMPQQSFTMRANSWADTEVLENLYQFPFWGADLPRLFGFTRSDSPVLLKWRQAVQWQADGQLHFKDLGFPFTPDRPLIAGNTILLSVDNFGTVYRYTGTVSVNGRPFELRDIDPRNTVVYPQLPLYAFMLPDHGSR